MNSKPSVFYWQLTVEGRQMIDIKLFYQVSIIHDIDTIEGADTRQENLWQRKHWIWPIM